MQNAQQQMAQLGKDLAEQLKNGQTDAAQQTLQKMTEQLKNGQLSQEQLKKCSRKFLRRWIQRAITARSPSI